MSIAAPIVVVAPDSLKGSCTAGEAAAALARGVRAVLGPTATVREVPLADGGEGTLDALIAAWDGRIVSIPTTDALGRAAIGRLGLHAPPPLSRDDERSSTPRPAAASVRAGALAIIETADANGLLAVSDVPQQALDADSFGVGTLVLAALDAGADELLLCLGGSATSDGGAGLLRALGARLLNAAGADVAPGARGLTELTTIDLTGLDQRARAASWRIACDVENPLTGPRGAAAVFGPQKGATEDEVVHIDAGLVRLTDALAPHSPLRPDELRAQPGLGAAGGLALGPVALMGATLVPGAELVSTAVGLSAALADATLIITGEGRFDRQSFDGKVVSRVISDAPPGTPVVVIAGSVALSGTELRAKGVTAAFSIAPGPATLSELQSNCVELLSEAAARVCGVFIARG
ncbi:glycerate kinase [Leucobacter luti]|uniref:glycerate kinase n=1 Tax=Leucobacter luti TaxID=340320 RepID=UPI001042DEB6|nr:glycerate kinase [Leucobacter luti]MCW2289395.1 glycerate kinase [Leucobacter luti]TCK39955.1 glycerate kinase [Leucobacter luti]